MSERVSAEAAGAGAQFAGYRLGQQVGQGIAGAVFRALDERGRQVALKIISSPLAADQAFSDRLMRDVRVAAAVGEPHILPVLEADAADGKLFVAMPYITGPDTRSLARTGAGLPAHRVMPIVWQLASALDAAHAAGLVHGDVKPSNIFIQAQPGQPDLVFLSDFGQGRTQAPAAMLAGTAQANKMLDCIAPEQMDRREGGRLADQYALACVAFELLTGRPAFPLDESGATVPPAEPELPRAALLRPDVPPAVDAVLARALDPVPAFRFAGCGEFAGALYGAFWPEARPAAPSAGAPTADADADAVPAPALPSAATVPAGAAPRAVVAQRLAGGPWLTSRPRRWHISPLTIAAVAVVAAAALAVGVIVATRPVAATPKPAPLPMSIAAASGMVPENGVVWVRYGEPSQRSAAHVYGNVKGATHGEIARLYAQPFPFRGASFRAGSPVTLHPAGKAKTASYSFQVTPHLATRYRVEIFKRRSSRRPLARSAATTVYVDGGWRSLQGLTPCTHPVCHEKLVGQVLVPPSALSTEMAKAVQVYFGVSLAQSASPPSPATLQLGGGDAHVTVKLVSAGAYQETITFTFTVGKTGSYNLLWNACAKDTVSKDGMGLPGQHLCGDTTVPGQFNYLGFS